MAGIVPNVGAGSMLHKILNEGENLLMKLYSNNVTPAEGDTAAIYLETVGPGYVAKPLTAGGWVIDSTTDPALAVYATQVWNFTGVIASLYGYYVVGASTGLLQWAERFGDGPYALPAAGGTLTIVPKLAGD